MDYFPIFLNLRDSTVLVVGGGAVAARKVELLLRAGARVRIVAPSLVEELRVLRAQGRVEHIASAYGAPMDAESLLAQAVLVIAATDRADVNEDVFAAARARGVPVNVVDDARRSTFIVPAIVDRAPVTVAIGTQGASPVLARHVRAQIEELLPPRLGLVARLAGRWRQRVRRAFSSVRERREFWDSALRGPVVTHALAGHEARAEFELRRLLRNARGKRHAVRGEVYLVGAGPGDPDLLTVRAARLLQQADVVLYDRLVSPEILDRARRDARRIYVGKEPGGHGLAQERVQGLLLRLALEGKRVCRLKGGDPFVFGRGGEELEALARHGVSVTVVPGITAALGAAAYAGIPLTHRDHSHSVTLVAGHLARSEDARHIDWESLARDRQTIVFYMGVGSLRAIVGQLVQGGAPLTRPAAIVERATSPGQRVVSATLATIAETAAAAAIGSPALLIVGDVVSLRDRTAAALSSALPQWRDGQLARAHNA